MKKQTPIAAIAIALAALALLTYLPDPKLPDNGAPGETEQLDTTAKVATAKTVASPIDRTTANGQPPSEHRDSNSDGSTRWLLTGIVTNEDGSRADDVLVRATAETFYFGRTTLPAARTDHNGRYAVDLEEWRHRAPLDREQFTLLVSALTPTQSAQSTAKFPKAANALESLTVRADMKFETLATVTGRVLDERGDPVVNATVQLRTNPESNDIMPPYDHTDEDGMYRIAIGMAGPHMLHTERTDVGIATLPLTIVRDQHIDAPDLVMKAASELAGQAVYPDGQPVADAELLVNRHDHITTDASGRFVIRTAEPGTYHISPPGQPEDGGEITTGEGFQQITIRTARLRMQFRGARNEPLVRQDVYAYWFPETFGPSIQSATSLDSLPPEVRKASVAHYEHGADMFAPRGSWFWIETPHGRERSALCVVEMARGRNETIATVKFAEPPLNAQLHVTAKLDNGKPVTDLFAELRPLAQAPRVPFAKVDDIKIGKAMRVPAGTYKLRVWQGWTSQYPQAFTFEETIHIAAGEQRKKAVTLTRGGLADIEVHRHGGKPGEQLDAIATVMIDGKHRPLSPYRITDPNKWRDVKQDFLKVGQRANSMVLLPVGPNTFQLRSGDDVWTVRANIIAGKHTHVRFDLDH